MLLFFGRVGDIVGGRIMFLLGSAWFAAWHVYLSSIIRPLTVIPGVLEPHLPLTNKPLLSSLHSKAWVQLQTLHPESASLSPTSHLALLATKLLVF